MRSRKNKWHSNRDERERAMSPVKKKKSCKDDIISFSACQPPGVEQSKLLPYRKTLLINTAITFSLTRCKVQMQEPSHILLTVCELLVCLYYRPTHSFQVHFQTAAQQQQKHNNDSYFKNGIIGFGRSLMKYELLLWCCCTGA